MRLDRHCCEGGSLGLCRCQRRRPQLHCVDDGSPCAHAVEDELDRVAHGDDSGGRAEGSQNIDGHLRMPCLKGGDDGRGDHGHVEVVLLWMIGRMQPADD